MDYHLNKQTLPQLSYALNTAVEVPLDADLTLPDYCPDIERILSCVLCPKVYLYNRSGDRLSVEGGSCVRLLYTDSDGRVRAYTYTAPFSESIPLREDTGDGVVLVEAKPEYINCRALSPRKLSLHGAFSLCVRFAVSTALPYYDYEDGGDLQTKGETLTASALCGMCGESFPMQEDITVGVEIGTLLSYRLSTRITELKAIHNKIMLSAELRLELLYLAADEKRTLSCMSYTLPLSRVIDCAGADEDTVIDGELTVMSDELRLNDDALDGSTLLSLDAKLHFAAMCYREQEVEVLSDAFSTERETQVRREPFSCCADTACRSLTDIGKATVGIGEGIGQIVEVHCEKLSASASVTDGNILISSKLCVGILYENSEGELRYAERDAQFSTKAESAGCDTVERLRASLDSLSYRLIDNGSVELRAELCYRMTLCRRASCSAVTAVSADDDAPGRQPDDAVILYYADSGDSVWEIAKRFCSRPADIMAENSLEGDRIDGTALLLIPTA